MQTNSKNTPTNGGGANKHLVESLRNTIRKMINEEIKTINSAESQFLNKVKLQNPDLYTKYINMVRRKGLEYSIEDYKQFDKDLIKQNNLTKKSYNLIDYFVKYANPTYFDVHNFINISNREFIDICKDFDDKRILVIPELLKNKEFYFYYLDKIKNDDSFIKALIKDFVNMFPSNTIEIIKNNGHFSDTYFYPLYNKVFDRYEKNYPVESDILSELITQPDEKWKMFFFDELSKRFNEDIEW